MKRLSVLACLLLAAGMTFGQEIPAGTLLPIMLNTTLDANTDEPGKVIKGRVEENVPLSWSSYIPAGSKVIGSVLRVSKPNATSTPELEIKFDRIRVRGRDIPITTNLRAIASMMEVFDAKIPPIQNDDGPNTWVTRKVGAQTLEAEAERGLAGERAASGPAEPMNRPSGSKCSGAINSDQKNALWVFSTEACGAYGFGDDLIIAHAGRADPVGEVVLQGRKNVMVRSGSGLLLRVRSGSSQ